MRSPLRIVNRPSGPVIILELDAEEAEAIAGALGRGDSGARELLDAADKAHKMLGWDDEDDTPTALNPFVPPKPVVP